MDIARLHKEILDRRDNKSVQAAIKRDPATHASNELLSNCLLGLKTLVVITHMRDERDICNRLHASGYTRKMLRDDRIVHFVPESTISVSTRGFRYDRWVDMTHDGRFQLPRNMNYQFSNK